MSSNPGTADATAIPGRERSNTLGNGLIEGVVTPTVAAFIMPARIEGSESVIPCRSRRPAP
ncbi:MAG: hypothetical protein NVS4B3_10120 [Gemmatimonadaceae bacterium]